MAQLENSHDASDAIARCERLFQTQKQAFQGAPCPPLDERKELLERLKQLLIRHQEALAHAIDADFGGRSADETRIAEILPGVQAVEHAQKHLKRWMAPSRRAVSSLFQPARSRVEYQPKGVVGIIAPWNYPLNLAIGPLVGALAAGNRCLVKMSEYTPATSALFRDLIAETFPENRVSVVTGDADVAAHFSALPFDHLLFTGSTAVGRKVMQAAAANLVPVTLELGGKSPAIISRDVPMADAASRIVFGKAFNAGQTCVAPDYVFCPNDRLDEFVDAAQATFRRMYPTLRDNPDYTAIIHDGQHQRLQAHLDDARAKGARLVTLNPADESLAGSGKLPMTLVLDTTPDMSVRQEELFGPILPVIGYDDLEEALDTVNDGPRPLALYYFDYDTARQNHVLKRTHSGGVCLNDTLMHVAQENLPFGGIGDSGMGHYHGREGFLTFSHHRGVFIRPSFNSGRFIHPPHGGWLHRLIYRLFIR